MFPELRVYNRPRRLHSSWAISTYLVVLFSSCVVISMSNPLNLGPSLDFDQQQRIIASQNKEMNNNQKYLNNINSQNGNIKTPTPVIGVLTQILRDYKRLVPTRKLHLVASYVKWLEMSGVQVLPILLNQDDAYYERMFSQTNGLVFPGGDNLLDPNRDTPMMVAAKKLYKLAVDANDRGDFYPIWGTCLGMELLTVLSSGRNALANCSAEDLAIPVRMKTRGRLFAASADVAPKLEDYDYPAAVVKMMTNDNTTYNHHQFCITDQTLAATGLDSFYRPLSYSNDTNGLEFVAVFEAFRYPFFGVQFHPEKPAFEFVVKPDQTKVTHSSRAIAVSRYLADFFAGQARLNGHQPIDPDKLASELIYASTPTYTAPLRDMYEQRYLFPYVNNGLDDSEFLDFILADGEKAPEYSGGSSSAELVAAASLGNLLRAHKYLTEQLDKQVDLDNPADKIELDHGQVALGAALN